MEGRQLLQYIIDTSDVLLAKKQEATEYLAKIEAAAQHRVHLTAGSLPPKEFPAKFYPLVPFPVRKPRRR